MKFLAIIFGIFFALGVSAIEKDEDVFKMVDILYNLNRGAEELDTQIEDWRIGNSDDFTNLIDKSSLLHEAILDANTTISGYSGLVETDTLRLQPPVYALTNTVRRLINRLIHRKAEIFAFNGGPQLASVVQGQIQDQQYAAGNTSATIVGKVPKDLQYVANRLAAGIKDNLQRGAEEFLCANCTSSISGAGSLASGSKSYIFALAAAVAAVLVL